MGESSKIQWTTHTWNPWQGCRKCSLGCRNCYMFADMARYGKDPLDIHRSADATFRKPLSWQRQIATGKRPADEKYVFTCSWSDWFIEEADAWRDDAWEIVRACPDLIFQILTKRSDRIADHLPTFWNEIKDRAWLGVTVENQATADVRIPHLKAVSDAFRFLSMEPLLGPVDLSRLVLRDPRPEIDRRILNGTLRPDHTTCAEVFQWNASRIHWAILGGESGSGARRCHLRWLRSLRDQCRATGIDCFVKQLGRFPIDSVRGPEFGLPVGFEPDGYGWEMKLRDSHGGDWSEWPHDLRIREMPGVAR